MTDPGVPTSTETVLRTSTTGGAEQEAEWRKKAEEFLATQLPWGWKPESGVKAMRDGLIQFQCWLAERGGDAK